MVFLLGVLCCLANAAVYRMNDGSQLFMLVPVYNVVPQAAEHGRLPAPHITGQYVVCEKNALDGGRSDEDAPCAKRPCVRKDVLPESSSGGSRGVVVPPCLLAPIKPVGESARASRAATDVVVVDKDAPRAKRPCVQQDVLPESSSGESCGAVVLPCPLAPRESVDERASTSSATTDVVVDEEEYDDDSAQIRRQNILRYLESSGCFVPEEDLHDVCKVNHQEILEDVMALIADRNNIVYDGRQYRLFPQMPMPPFREVEPYTVMKDLLRNPEFEALSVAKQSHYIYAQRRGYVSVSTVALLIEGFKRAKSQSFTVFRFKRLLFLKDKILKEKQLLTMSEYSRTCPSHLGRLCCNDLVVIKDSLELYAQGREALKFINAPKSSNSWVPADVKYPEVLACLEDSKGKPVGLRMLSSFITSYESHIHRDLYCVIVCLRRQGRNITHQNEGFSLQEGNWEIKHKYFKRALWEMLDKPEYQGIKALDFFLNLSDMHYDPCASVVEEVIKLKKFCAGQNSLRNSALKRKIWNIALSDGWISLDPEYYKKKLPKEKGITQNVLKGVQRLFSVYYDTLSEPNPFPTQEAEHL